MKVIFQRALAGQWLCAVLIYPLLIAGCTQRYGELYAEHSEEVWLKPASAVVSSKQVYTQTSEPFSGSVKTRFSGKLQNPAINELSGLAASKLQADTYWAINDSGNQPELFALSATGASKASFKLPLKNNDWEDISTFEREGVAWIAVADVGDNLRRRQIHHIHFIPEPSLSQGQQPTMGKALEGISTLSFRYEDGPQNVEAMAVSVREQKIFLIAKNSVTPAIYTLPLQPASGNEVLVAKRESKLHSLGATREDSALEILIGSRVLLAPTAMDFSPDDRYAVVANYRHVYLFRRNPLQPWSEALSEEPQVITSHRLAQSEAVSFSADALSVLVGSEGRRSTLLVVDAYARDTQAALAKIEN